MRKCTCRTSYLPGPENWLADCLSWKFLDPHEWSLTPGYLLPVFQKCGFPKIDLMTSSENAQLLKISHVWCPESMVQDALSLLQSCLYITSDSDSQDSPEGGRRGYLCDLHSSMVTEEVVVPALAGALSSGTMASSRTYYFNRGPFIQMWRS